MTEEGIELWSLCIKVRCLYFIVVE